MESLKIGNIRSSVKEGINPLLEQTINRYERQLGLYTQAITKLVNASCPQLEAADNAIRANSRTNPINPVSRLSAPYFVNEDVIGGSSIVKSALEAVNGTYTALGLPAINGKLKLGPGIGYAQAPRLYSDLIKMGVDSPELSLNYNAPNGETMTRYGLSLLMNAKTEGSSAYGQFDVFLTSGATESIDAVVSTFAKTNPGKSIAILGPSYYAASYSAQYRDIPVTQIVKEGGNSPLFPTIDEIIAKTPRDAGMIVLTAPNNPTGEMYSESEMRRLFVYAKKRNLLVMFDDIFGELKFANEKSVVQIAQEEGALDTLVVVDSLSKSKNIPGARPGILATTNSVMKDALSDYLIAVKCNPPLIYGPLFMFEGLARETEKRLALYPQTNPGLIFDLLTEKIKPTFSKSWFLEAFSQWSSWNKSTMEYYRQNLDFTKLFLQKTGTELGGSPDQGAFNTLIRVTSPGLRANSLDFLFKLMVGTGTYTQTGPCFGLNQSQWDDLLGVWTRITYASDRESLAEGLIRLAALARTYEEKEMGNSEKFPTLQVNY